MPVHFLPRSAPVLLESMVGDLGSVRLDQAFEDLPEENPKTGLENFQ
jgi:hypothetical protein